MSQYIFLDESGDLGFKPDKRNSQYFLVTFLFVHNAKPLEKIVKKVHQSLRKHVKKLSGGILHCVKEKPATRKKLLMLLRTQECSIMVIFLNKAEVYTHLHDKKHVLYNYVAKILIDRIIKKKFLDKSKKITLIAERRETNKFLNQNFRQYLKRQNLLNHKLNLDVDICTPQESKVLQLVDFVSWSIFRKYEKGDQLYYDIIKDRIVEESGLFSKKTKP